MNTICLREAYEKYLEEGMSALFTFAQYIDYLATCHIEVVRR